MLARYLAPVTVVPTRRMKKLLVAATAGFALLGWAETAGANVVTASSSAFTITDTISTATTGGPAPLSATVTFADFAFTATTFTMSMNIVNNTSSVLFSSGRLTAVGFNVDPNATSISDTSTIFNSFLDSTFPSFKTVDVCSSTGPACAGGGGGDLAPGATNYFTLTLVGDFSGGQIDLGANSVGAPELFDFKWQTDIGSFESQCAYGGSCSSTRVPEPAGLVLLGSGLLGLGLIRRRVA